MRKIRDVRNTMQQDTEQARGRDIAKTSVEFGLEMIWMAGTETYTVVLDANVLYPIAVIDLVFSLVGTNLFYARWSDDIATEAVTAVEPLTARSIESFSLPPLSRYAAREPEKSRLLEEGNYLLYIDLLSNAVLKAGTEI